MGTLDRRRRRCGCILLRTLATASVGRTGARKARIAIPSHDCIASFENEMVRLVV